MQQQEYGLKAGSRPREQNVQLALERALDEGEELLWSAQPSPQSHNRPAPARVFLVLGSIFASIGLVLVILGLIFSLALGIIEAAVPFLVVGGTFLFLGLIYIVVAIFLKIPLKNTIYAITPQRIIVIQAGQNTTIDSYGKKDIGQITSLERPDGAGDIFFQGNSGGFGYGSYQRYNGSYNGTGNWANSMNKGKLLGITGVREVERLIRRTFLSESLPPITSPYRDERGYSGSEF